MILEHRDEWVREILVIGPPKYIRELERDYLTAIDAKNDVTSFNGNNATGIMSFQKGSLNPMSNPQIKQRVVEAHSGKRHWRHNLNGRTDPQLGQKRPSISGDKHPNKRPEVAEKIRLAHLGRSHPYHLGDKNPMRNPEVVAKLSGNNHWVNNPANRRTCEYCNLTNISKSNYTRWHGENCKFKEKEHGKTV